MLHPAAPQALHSLSLPPPIWLVFHLFGIQTLATNDLIGPLPPVTWPITYLCYTGPVKLEFDSTFAVYQIYFFLLDSFLTLLPTASLIAATEAHGDWEPAHPIYQTYNYALTQTASLVIFSTYVEGSLITYDKPFTLLGLCWLFNFLESISLYTM